MSSYRHIYVLGGHRLSANYLTHLIQAGQEGKIEFQSLSFVEPEIKAPAVKQFTTQANHISKSYTDFLTEKIRDTSLVSTDVFVPDHTAPHVIFQVFIQALKEDLVDVSVVPFTQNLALPFQKNLDSGICAISYATWICPLECDEPALCPAIDNDRTWDFGEFLQKQSFEGVDSIHLFGCEQMAYGVCGIPLTLIQNEYQKLLQSMQKGHTFLVGTHSKCHGILGVGVSTPM